MATPSTPPCPPGLRTAFLAPPTYVQLPKGERLYRIVSLPLDRPRVLASPWWIRHRDFVELQARAYQLGRSVPGTIRTRLAITTE